MMRTLIKIRTSSWLLLLGLCVSCVLALGLPRSWGLEAGPLENFQTVTLLLGLLVALLAAYRQRMMAVGKIWWVAATLWLLLLGREQAWGVLDALRVDAGDASAYRVSTLWWTAVLEWACAGMLVMCAYWVLRYRLWQRVLVRWLTEGAIPWGCLGVVLLAAVMAALAQGQLGMGLPAVVASASIVMEAAAECWMYLSLWWGQWLLVHHMQEWRLSNYLQTMHFAQHSVGERFERRSI